MYKFFKLKNSNVWLLEVENEEVVKQHYKLYCEPIIKEGVSFITDKYIYKKILGHPVNMFAKGFEVIENTFRNGSENETTIPYLLTMYLRKVDEARNIGKYPLYLYSDLRIYASNSIDEYDEIYESEILKYPDEQKMDIKDVKYLQWHENGHWYAKIGKMDIVDEKGNQKWNTKYEAEIAAQNYIYNNA